MNRTGEGHACIMPMRCRSGVWEALLARALGIGTLNPVVRRISPTCDGCQHAMTRILFASVKEGHAYLEQGHWFFDEGQWAVCASEQPVINCSPSEFPTP